MRNKAISVLVLGLAACGPAPLQLSTNNSQLKPLIESAVAEINAAVGSNITEAVVHGGTLVVADKRDGVCGYYDHGNDVIALDAICTHQESLIVHEIGHALGLSHSKDPESVMFHVTPQNTMKEAALSLAQALLERTK